MFLGVGDMKVHEVSFLPDPCPLPEVQKKRTLLEKERLIYAPFSGVGGIVYDKDAVYIELKGSHSHKENEEESEQKAILKSVIEQKETVDDQMKNTGFKLFSDGSLIYSDMVPDIGKKSTKKASIKALDSDDDDEEGKDNRDSSGIEDDMSSDSGDELGSTEKVNKHKRSKKYKSESSDSEGGEIIVAQDTEKLPWDNNFDDNDDKSDNEDFGNKWRENMTEKASTAYLERQSTTHNIMKLVYGVFHVKNNSNDTAGEADRNSTDESESEEIGGLFKRITQKQKRLQKDKQNMNSDECSLFYSTAQTNSKDWLDAEIKQSLLNCFVTGKRSSGEDASELLKLDDASVGDSDEDLFGDFEDMETGEKHKNEEEEDEKPSFKKGKGAKGKGAKRSLVDMSKADILAKKLKLKARFDNSYDNPDENRITGDHAYYENLKAEALKQSDLNKSVFDELDDGLRVEVEGFRPGMYVRINFKSMPHEFVDNFDATYPILVGALNMSEENIGFVSCKVKKHRWYKKILKTNDPLIISMGWRRFQTVPIFSKIEDDMKCRYLKYTPEHVTCNMHFYGPVTPQNTGILALQTLTNDSNQLKQLGFRIAATGSVNEINKSTQIVKKLKLVGTPLKILKKTAFIKDMFNSSLEVAKFEGAKIKTVSGIRGQIKKAINKPEGCFRATFEDKILLSDIVFCRTWFKVNVTQFYTTVTNLLLDVDKKNVWAGMKTLGQLKRERNVQNEPNKDSLYEDIKRDNKVFKPLIIPKALQKALPYKDKPKNKVISSKSGNITKNRIALIKSPHEQQVAGVLKMVKASFDKKADQAKIAVSQRIEKHKKDVQVVAWKKLKRQKELKKKVCRALSKMGKK